MIWAGVGLVFIGAVKGDHRLVRWGLLVVAGTVAVIFGLQWYDDHRAKRVATS